MKNVAEEKVGEKKIRDLILSNPKYSKHFYLSSTLISIILLLSIGLYAFAKDISRDWIPGNEIKILCFDGINANECSNKEKPLDGKTVFKKPAGGKKYITVTNKNLIYADKSILTRLADQFNEIQEWKKIHLKIIVFYYIYDFIFTWMAMFLGVFIGLFSLFISNKGWQKINPYLLNAFIVVVASSVIFVSVPAVFKHKENINNNKAMYMSYQDMENRFLSYVATGEEDSDLKNPIRTPEKFIEKTDRLIYAVSKFPLEMDSNSGPGVDQILKNYIETGKK